MIFQLMLNHWIKECSQTHHYYYYRFVFFIDIKKKKVILNF